MSSRSIGGLVPDITVTPPPRPRIMAATTRFLGYEGRCSLRQCGSSAVRQLASVPARNVVLRPRPTRAGLFDGLFGGKPAAKPAKPAKPGMKPISGSCKTCQNKGGVTCAGCKGSGKNKSNGNPFERYKCYDCQARTRTQRRKPARGCSRSTLVLSCLAAIRHTALGKVVRLPGCTQGFGLVPCKACGRGGRGLTPEQTGER
jgi:hypothetical protein